jgi:hypothetical protein
VGLERGGVVGVPGEQADAAARLDLQLDGTERERVGQRFAEPFDRAERCLARSRGVLRASLEISEHEQELVPPVPGEQVAGTARVVEPGGHLAQQLVAGRVPEAVVHELELVQVDARQPERRAVRAGACNRGGEVGVEERTVRQPREGVVRRVAAQALLELPAPRPGAPVLVDLAAQPSHPGARPDRGEAGCRQRDGCVPAPLLRSARRDAS